MSAGALEVDCTLRRLRNVTVMTWATLVNAHTHIQTHGQKTLNKL